MLATTLFQLLAVFSTVAVAFDARQFLSRANIFAKKDDLNRLHSRAPAQCQPFTGFKSASDLSSFNGAGTFEPTDRGLHLNLQNPGNVQRNGNVNSAVAQGALLNSAFEFLYGVVTFRVQAPIDAGVETYMKFIDPSGNEQGFGLLGADCARFRSTSSGSTDQEHTIGYGAYITGFHNYTVDWTEERIQWSVNNRVVRTLTPAEANADGQQRYPTNPARIQFGILDGSSPASVSESTGGPINWQNAPSTILATVKQVSLECH